MESPKEFQDGDDRIKMNAERGNQLCGLRRLKYNLLMAGPNMDRKTSFEQNIPGNLWKPLVVLGLVTYTIFISFHNQLPSPCELIISSSLKNYTNSPTPPKSSTNLSHLIFGIVGSAKALQRGRKNYIESWWRPNATRGLLYLDEFPSAPSGLLPWSTACPPYRVSNAWKGGDNAWRIFGGIREVVREVGDDDSVRWVVMGDDDTVFFVDNIVDVVSEYDEGEYYYLGGASEYIPINNLFSFDQGFGGAGFILSYPLAKAVAHSTDDCINRYALTMHTSDSFTMACIADLGVNLSPLKGIHQIDLSGDISGFLSSHPNFPVMSLHHFDAVDPIFPNMDRYKATRHLMKAGVADQSRLLQQTICHHRQTNWSFSISWGYSAYIYENIHPRNYLRKPIETFRPFLPKPKPRPFYMFNTRLPYNASCEAPHLFFFKDVNKSSTGTFTTYSRAAARGLPPCSMGGNHSADFIIEISVFSPPTKRKKTGRCECCDIVGVGGAKAELKIRECMINENIA